MPETEAKGKPKASMSIRVYRAATNTWEDPIEVPCVIEDNGDPATLKDRLMESLGLLKPKKG